MRGEGGGVSGEAGLLVVSCVAEGGFHLVDSL